VNKFKQFQKNCITSGMMILQRINQLSIDVVIGSLFSGIFAAYVFNAEPDLLYWIILPVSVWVIYKTDHLLDIKRKGPTNGSSRAIFTARNYNTLLILTLILAALCFGLAILLFDRRIIFFGLGLGILSIIYLFTVYLFGGDRSNEFLKAVVVSFIYTVGIWGTPLIIQFEIFSLSHIILIVCFYFLALTNIMLLLNIQNSPGSKGSSTEYRKIRIIKRIIAASLFLVTTTCLASLLLTPDTRFFPCLVILLTMALASALIKIGAGYLSALGIFRISTEFVFWIPGLIILWN
jgi:hypothetical protein